MNTAGANYNAARVWTPFRLLVEAKGETFNTYTSASFFDNGSTGSIPPWLLNSPGEYSENLLSLLLYIKNNCGFTPTYCSILNEAGNGNPVTSLVIRNVIKALGPRMRAAGLTTMIEGPECMAADQSWNYLNASPNGMRYDAEAMKYVGLLSYHLYGTNDPYRDSIRIFGAAQNLPTAMTEYMSSISVNILYDDLTKGGVSVWDFYALNEYMPFTNNSNTWFTTNNTYWQCGQVIRYVRPGAVRVDASSSGGSLRPLAFVKNGQTTLVIFNNTNGGATSTTITGLPSGTYGLSETDNGGTYYQEKGLQTVSGAFTLTVPNNSIITLYPHANGNLSPVITDRSAYPSYLTLPASTSTLSSSAQDPEAGTLSYSWSVKSKPSAATVVIASPTSASTTVSGLTAAGEYVFTLAVSDGATTAAKDLAIPVFNGNQPPDLVEFCQPAPNTTLRRHSLQVTRRCHAERRSRQPG